MPDFIMLIGPSGCGKSTVAKTFEGYDCDIHSSDVIRGELWGDENDQQNPSKVFDEMFNRSCISLMDGRNVVYDATNLNAKRRTACLNRFKSWNSKYKVDIHYCAVVVVARETECVCRNLHRKRVVPIEVINRQFRQIQLPWFFEGWDEIYYTVTSGYPQYGQPWGELLHCLDIPHDNPHHPNDVLAHSLKVAAALGEPFSDDWKLGILHDCGKPETKGWTNTKGEIDTVAHYYNHHYLGAYKSLLFDWEDGGKFWNNYLRAMAIQFHMEPWFRSGEKLEEFYAKLGDDDLVDMIKRLHKADKEEA